MGFRLMDDDEMPQPAMELEREQHAAGDVAPLAPEDELAGVDIGGEVQPDAGQAIEGQLVYAPDRGDHLNVNGTELFPHTALATSREACAFFNLSQSGGKDRCLKRLWEHQKGWNSKLLWPQRVRQKLNRKDSQILRSWLKHLMRGLSSCTC